MVKSNPTAFHDFIKSVDVGKDKEKAKAKDAAIPIAKKIDDKKQEPLDGKTKKEKEASKAIKVKDVKTLLALLAVPTSKLFGDVALAGEPKLDYKKTGSGHAKSMTAVRLNNKQKEKGSQPTKDMTSSFKILNNRRQEGNPEASYYVKGHMLNENVGGPGDWKNLTPLSRKGNSDHESIVESLVKAAFGSGAVVEYNVVANYGYGKNAGRIPADDPKAIEKKAIIKEEENVPVSLTCEAFIMEKEGTDWKPKQKIVPAGTIVDNPIGQDASSYTLSDSVARPDIFLNSADAAAIATIEGIDGGLAAKIVFAHEMQKKLKGSSQFKSYYDLSDARKDKAFHRIFTTSSEQEKVEGLEKLTYVKLYPRHKGASTTGVTTGGAAASV
jgi:hypothetical protein